MNIKDVMDNDVDKLIEFLEETKKESSYSRRTELLRIASEACTTNADFWSYKLDKYKNGI